MNDLDKFIDATIKHISKATGIPMRLLMNSLELTVAANIQRHYVQAGPWAEMLREG